MDAQTAALIGTLLAFLGAVGAWVKARAESRQITVAAATDVVQLLREEVKRQTEIVISLRDELKTQRDLRITERDHAERRIAEMQEELAVVQHRVENLEWWIINNTEITDVSQIHGGQP